MTKKRQPLPVSSELWLLKDLAPPPEGVAAAVSLFASSTNSIQIVRRQCCLLQPSEQIFLLFLVHQVEDQLEGDGLDVVALQGGGDVHLHLEEPEKSKIER